MQLITQIFEQFVAASEIAEAAENITEWLQHKLKTASRKARPEVVETQMARLAQITEPQIRDLARKVDQKTGRPIPEVRREELIAAISNLSRNLRSMSAVGSLDSSVFRSDRLLDLLLRQIEPLRHVNEPVAPGSPWILRKHLGMGGFGEVWLATNPGLPTPRAYKFFTNDAGGTWLGRELNNLVELVRQFGEHEHIVKLLDVQTENCRFPYLALEYMGGGSLEDWILADAAVRPALEPAEIVRQIVAGLAAAHSRNLAHRDVKPSNVLLTAGPDVRIKLADFGLGRIARSRPIEESGATASMTGLVGTQLYLPPEAQHRGDRRTPYQDDVFAVGVVWFQLCVGAIERPPYDFVDRLRSHDVDSHTIGLIERCLAHPGRRFKDAPELREALTEAVPPLRPCPAGRPDVQHLAREFLATASA